MAPHDGVCQLSGHDQRMFTYVLTLNDSSEQDNRCMASVVVMHCPVTPLAYVFSMAEFFLCFYDNLQFFTVLSDAVHLGAVYVISPLLHSSLHMEKNRNTVDKSCKCCQIWTLSKKESLLLKRFFAKLLRKKSFFPCFL